MANPLIRIRLHTPGWLDVGDDFRRDYEAPTWDELVKTERLAGWAGDPAFDHWCLSDDHLMAEMKPQNGERHFWVIAYVLEGLSLLPLPQWAPPPTRRCRFCNGPINSSNNCQQCTRPHDSP